MPKKPGWVLIRLCENAEQISEEREDGTTETWWEYDEYTLEMPKDDILESALKENLDAFLSAAKNLEEETLNKLEMPNRVKSLKEENKSLKAQVTALSDQNDFFEECLVEMAETVYE